MTDVHDRSRDLGSPQISRFAFAMFDVLGFSKWVEAESLASILASYQQLIERAVLRPNEKGSVTAFHTPEGQMLAVARAPEYAYFSDIAQQWGRVWTLDIRQLPVAIRAELGHLARQLHRGYQAACAASYPLSARPTTRGMGFWPRS